MEDASKEFKANQPSFDHGKQIVEYRKLRGLTQQELADQTGVSLRTVQRIEKGEVSPRPYTLRQLKQALDIPAQTLQIDQNDAERTNVQILRWIIWSSLLIPFFYAVIAYFFWKKAHWTSNSRTKLKPVIILNLIVSWIVLPIGSILLLLVMLAFDTPLFLKYLPTLLLPYWLLCLINIIASSRLIKKATLHAPTPSHS